MRTKKKSVSGENNVNCVLFDCNCNSVHWDFQLCLRGRGGGGFPGSPLLYPSLHVILCVFCVVQFDFFCSSLPEHVVLWNIYQLT